MGLTAGSLVLTSAVLPSTKPLVERSKQEILQEYVIVGDFSLKEPTRNNSGEVFWRYPVKLPKIQFPLQFPDTTDKQALAKDFPPTPGSGRPIQHMNRGRTYFLDGDYETARKTWLGGRARYGEDYRYHRRNDYFTAYSFIMIARQNHVERELPWSHPDVRHRLVNANTFLSWAFGVKKDLPDPLLERITPLALYNQAAIYYRYDKWAAAYGIAERGLNFLRKTGRMTKRADFRRMMAELFIRNRDYMEAVQHLDLALRQQPSPELAAKVFARIGDIYFDLNNFELAEDMYALAIRMDRERELLRPGQFILRGESLFWLGRFQESQKMMDYGLRSMASLKAVEAPPNEHLQALASLRLADNWLALGRNDKAKVAYFRHSQEFRDHETATFARLRLACLELPYYQGNNIKHARELLDDLKASGPALPKPAEELAWTCEVASYAQHERTPQMVDRVRRFYQKYPNSKFLRSLIPAVREVQAQTIERYFAADDPYGAVSFFEKTRDRLFPKVSEQLGAKLFRAYVDTFQSAKAREFYPMRAQPDHDLARLRQAVMLAEASQLKPTQPWARRNRRFARELGNHEWSLPYSESAKLYVDRVMNADDSLIHVPWIYRLARRWLGSRFSLACELIYPMLQALRERSGGSVRLEPGPRTFVTKNLADLLRYETACAYSVLEWERRLYEGENVVDLAKLYLARDFLPVNRSTANLYFAVAEDADQAGRRGLATQLWQRIIDQGDVDLPEYGFAKSRLNNRRTELEKLWDNP